MENMALKAQCAGVRQNLEQHRADVARLDAQLRQLQDQCGHPDEEQTTTPYQIGGKEVEGWTRTLCGVCTMVLVNPSRNPEPDAGAT